MGEIVTDWLARPDAFLLGRQTYEIFAGHWPRVPDEHPIAATLNKLPEHVISATLDAPDWRHTTGISFLGTGKRPFEEPALAGALRLVDTKTTEVGAVALTYEPDERRILR